MANSFFKFKHFIIQQDKCAMKVCTDSCLFGAWIAGHLKETTIYKILDIGTGTGLLSLMLAQKSTAKIDAVEINEEAFKEAKANFETSLWKERLHIDLADIRYLNKDEKYDLIVCNPPFYQKSLQSPDNKINQARHGNTLQPFELIDSVKLLLEPKGILAVMLPHQLNIEFINEANKHGLYLNKMLEINHSPGTKFIRAFLILSQTKKEILTDNLYIKNNEGEYSPAFRTLLKDYYLAF